MKIITLLLFFSLSAEAFTLIGAGGKGWRRNDIAFSYDISECPNFNIEPVLTQAFAIWNNIPGSNLKLSLAGATTNRIKDPPTIFCETDFSTYGSINNIPGVALDPSEDSEGYIDGGFVVLNASAGQASINNFDPTLLAVILAHEIGHAIGLGHTSDQNALMYFDASYKTSLGLSQDDIDGVTYLYPRDELSGDKPFGCARIENINNNNNSRMILLLLLLPLLAAIILRMARAKRKLFGRTVNI
jgi:hypothetical protein